MYKFLLLPALLLFAFTARAQKAVIKGKLVDSLNNAPIELATVAILDMRDTTSSLLVYTLSDKSGEFSLHNLPTGTPLKILITEMAYKPFRKTLTLKKGETLDFGTIHMEAKLLNEIIINGERPPVVVRKDTIEFNAEAFKTRPNAVIEELLKKLPGMEVGMDGKINFNGKDIGKILVNGNEFFKNDYRIATRNLDADMLDKVQIYDDRENDPDHLIPESKVNKIINLKLKGALKKSEFGKIYGGGGTEGRYTSGGLFNMFRDTLQISILGQANNLNNTGFSFDDLYGNAGFSRGGSSAFYRGGLSPFGNLGGSGIQRVVSGGVNINTDYGKKLKINLAYYLTRTHTDFNQTSTRQQLLNDTDFTSNSVNSNINIATSHNVSASVRWTPNKQTILTYDPIFTYTDNEASGASTVNSFSSVIPKISLADNSNTNSGNSLSFQQSFDYNHQFKKKGESIDINHSLQINPGDRTGYNINNLTSYTSSLSSFLLNRNSNSTNRNTSVNVGVGYRYPFSKKLTGNVGVSDNYNHQLNNTITYDFDPANGQYDSFLQTLSTDLTRNQWTESVNAGLTYNFKQGMQIVVSAYTQILQVNNQFDRGIADINQHFVNVLPVVNLNLGKFSLGYQAGFTLPNIGDMIPYTVVSSPLYSVTGNPDLKPTKRNDYSFNFNNYTQSQLNYSANATASFEQNTIFRQNTLDAVGATTSRPINMNGQYRFSTNLRIGKRFKKHNGFQLSETSMVSANESHGFFEINGQDGYQNAYNLSFYQQFSVDWKNIIDLEQSYNLANSVTNYTGVNFSNVNYFTHVLNSHFIITAPKKINIEGTYSYTYRPLVPPGFQKSTNLLNLSIAREILKKDRGEIKLSCYDILNQNISTTRYVSANTISDVQSQILRRYFMITLQFKFNKTNMKGGDGSTHGTVRTMQINNIIY